MKKVVAILVVCFFVGGVLFACGGMHPFSRTSTSTSTSTRDAMAPLDVPDLPPTVDDGTVTKDVANTKDTQDGKADESLSTELGKLNDDISASFEQVGAKIRDVTTTTTTVTTNRVWGRTNGWRTIIDGRSHFSSSSENFKVTDIQLKRSHQVNGETVEDDEAFIPMVL